MVSYPVYVTILYEGMNATSSVNHFLPVMSLTAASMSVPVRETTGKKTKVIASSEYL